MPRAPARIRKRYIEGKTEVLDWEVEENLVYGHPVVFGPPSTFRTAAEWRRAWSRHRDTIMPKILEYRPGSRPFAMYATGEIPRREVLIQLPAAHVWRSVDVREDDGTITTHYLNVPEPFMHPEIKHLYRLGVIDDAEIERRRALYRRLPKYPSGYVVDPYPLEMSLYE
jgi:hypothetical protein